MWRFLVLGFALPVMAQSPDGDVHRAGEPGLEVPKVLKRAEPKYTSSALSAGVQGTAVFQLVVNEQGLPADIAVVSPLGFGLDEQGRAAIEQWRFKPATKNGTPVKLLATIEISFRLAGQYYDSKAEKQRTVFNLSLQALKANDAKRREQALAAIQDLSKQKYPPAMYVHGKFLEAGEVLPQDAALGRDLIARSARENYGPALYEVARAALDAAPGPAELEKAKDTIRNAAILGSPQAQYFLGASYELGTSVYPRNDESARQFFRLCAAQGQAECQFRLGRSLLNREERRERDYVQAIAWLELAREQGIAPAAPLLDAEQSRITPAQAGSVRELKPRLVRR
jgi:TonB family protein